MPTGLPGLASLDIEEGSRREDSVEDYGRPPLSLFSPRRPSISPRGGRQIGVEWCDELAAATGGPLDDRMSSEATLSTGGSSRRVSSPPASSIRKIRGRAAPRRSAGKSGSPPRKKRKKKSKRKKKKRSKSKGKDKKAGKRSGGSKWRKAQTIPQLPSDVSLSSLLCHPALFIMPLLAVLLAVALTVIARIRQPATRVVWSLANQLFTAAIVTRLWQSSRPNVVSSSFHFLLAGWVLASNGIVGAAVAGLDEQGRVPPVIFTAWGLSTNYAVRRLYITLLALHVANYYVLLPLAYRNGVPPHLHRRSLFMPVTALLVVLFVYSGPAIDAALNVNIIEGFFVIGLLLWGAALVAQRYRSRVHLDTAYLALTTLLVSHLPGVLSIVQLRLVTVTSGQPLGGVVVLLAFGSALIVLRAFASATLRGALPVLQGLPVEFMFDLACSAFTNLLFLFVPPLSAAFWIMLLLRVVATAWQRLSRTSLMRTLVSLLSRIPQPPRRTLMQQHWITVQQSVVADLTSLFFLAAFCTLNENVTFGSDPLHVASSSKPLASSMPNLLVAIAVQIVLSVLALINVSRRVYVATTEIMPDMLASVPLPRVSSGDVAGDAGGGGGGGGGGGAGGSGRDGVVQELKSTGMHVLGVEMLDYAKDMLPSTRRSSSRPVSYWTHFRPTLLLMTMQVFFVFTRQWLQLLYRSSATPLASAHAS
eukprot:PLAT306.2.p1 GENE.PLAT306.2~~PLAT306.2.p1  ORF type:complete len:703 (-),score=348.74 PLAT306.2:1715-3823(-)